VALGTLSNDVAYADGVLTVKYRGGGICARNENRNMETVIVLTCDPVWPAVRDAVNNIRKARPSAMALP
jgi:hypothetical protein